MPLSLEGSAEVESLSCASAGNCVAGGYYTDASRQLQAFVVSESGSAWGRAQVVRGFAALNVGGRAQISSVSCASAGNCVAGGYYTDASRQLQAFVVSESGSAWGRAREVPGMAALNVGGRAQISSVSCASAGNCAAGGFYTDESHGSQAFVVTERHGIWTRARRVAGPTAPRSVTVISTVSCASAGNCAAGGLSGQGFGHAQAFVVSERNGRWGRAKQVPGIAALNADGNADVSSVSCPSAGNCEAGGCYQDGSGHLQAFVVNERNGSWGQAAQVPGMAALDRGGYSEVTSVSCASVGSCAAGGSYQDGSGHVQAFVVSQADRIWGRAQPVPGIAALNAGGYAWIYSVSCAPAARCTAAGSYVDSVRYAHPFFWTKP